MLPGNLQKLSSGPGRVRELGQGIYVLDDTFSGAYDLFARSAAEADQEDAGRARKELAEWLRREEQQWRGLEGRRTHFSRSLAGIWRACPDYEILMVADECGLEAWAVTCLPRLYFRDVSGEASASVVIWREALAFWPNSTTIVEENRYCSGEVVRVRVDSESASGLDLLNWTIEEVRRECVFDEMKSLLGAVEHRVEVFREAQEDGMNVRGGGESGRCVA